MCNKGLHALEILSIAPQQFNTSLKQKNEGKKRQRRENNERRISTTREVRRKLFCHILNSDQSILGKRNHALLI